MVPFFIIGGVAVAAAVAAVAYRRRQFAIRMERPEGIVFMEESVLNDFLTKEHDRTHPEHRLGGATAESQDSAAETDSSSNDELSSAESAEDPIAEPGLGADGKAERFVRSDLGGGTVVAGPPVDMADEGWAPDPTGGHEWRYFDSDGWSEYVLDGEDVGTDPLSSASNVTSASATSDSVTSDSVTSESASSDIATSDTTSDDVLTTSL